MDTIKIGEPQPKACSKCGLLKGYQLTDNVRGQYLSIYNEDGQYFEGTYSDSMSTTKMGTRAYCSNCGNDLKLKVDRKEYPF